MYCGSTDTDWIKGGEDKGMESSDREVNGVRQELMTVDQAASFLQVTPQTIYRYLRDGDLESVKFKGSRRIYYDSLLKLAKLDGK